MLFHTFEFLIFFSVLLGTAALLPGSASRKLLYVIASCVFYMWWQPVLILLLAYYIVTGYWIGKLMAVTEDPRRRRALVALSVFLYLGALSFFKYANFLSENVQTLLRLLGSDADWGTLSVLLPVGISFYTFEVLTYLIDIHRRVARPARSFLDFCVFLTLFPRLIAGPIVRASDFLPQLDRPIRLHFSQETFFLLLRGLAKKVLIADNVAVLPNLVFADPEPWPSVIIWLAAISFSVQIYCDFSGYSDIAIGLARVLGFRLPLNFDRPYLARNPTDFWRRWHISLSTWLRDYLYIPLGGNRAGLSTTYRNILITMLLGGLWHGASWNFVLWGLLHALALIVHRLWTRGKIQLRADETGRLRQLAAVAAMQTFVVLAWISFRVTDTEKMWIVYRKALLFDFQLPMGGVGLGRLSLVSTLLFLGGFLVAHLLSAQRGLDERLGKARPAVALLACVAAGLLLFVFWPLAEAPFIYFQF